MNFFGNTYNGPQNYIRDMLRKEYKEPMNRKEMLAMMEKVLQYSTCTDKHAKPDFESSIRMIDMYIGRVDGFAYGSFQRYLKMKKKGLVKPVSPAEVYRLPIASSHDYGWWQCDPALEGVTWFHTIPRYPQPQSPNTRVLEAELRKNKYASLF